MSLRSLFRALLLLVVTCGSCEAVGAPREAISMHAVAWAPSAEPAGAKRSPDKVIAQTAPLSADAAAAAVQSRYGGRVLSVKPAGNAFAVKVLHPNGRVVVYWVDRQSGQIQ